MEGKKSQKCPSRKVLPEQKKLADAFPVIPVALESTLMTLPRLSWNRMAKDSDILLSGKTITPKCSIQPT
jgi:hypothetical protein